MFYISSKKNDLYGVTDTQDGKEEFYSRDTILSFVRNQGIEIDGVGSHSLCKVVLPKDTVTLFKQGKINLAVSSMTLSNESFGLRFKSKPTGREMSFVHNDCLNISRIDVNSFSYDKGSSKSYRSGLELDDILVILEGYSNWKLIDAKVGRF